MAFRVPAPDGAKGEDNLPLMVLPPDTVLKDGYRLNYLSSGGMSITYTAVKAGEKYLIKEVEAGDPKKVIAITQEKFILERLNHPQIVNVHDLFEYDGFYYMVTEYIEGETMDRLVSPFPNVFIQEKVLINWAVQLCDIFEYLHTQRPPVIYRDLKPRNVIKDRNGKLHLIDFGIARAYKQGRSKDTEPMGSAMTASPEHYGGAQTDQRSDIYTIGATIHYLATNGRGNCDEPFVFTPVRSINPKLSESIERVIIKALETEAAKRYSTVVEMRQALLNSREVPLPVMEPFGRTPLDMSRKGEGADSDDLIGTAGSKVMKALPVLVTVAVCLLAIFLGILIVDRIVGKRADGHFRTQGSSASASKPHAGSETAAISTQIQPETSTGRQVSAALRTEEVKPTAPEQSQPGPAVTPSLIIESPVKSAPPKVAETRREPLNSSGKTQNAGAPFMTESPATPPVIKSVDSTPVQIPAGQGRDLGHHLRVLRPGEQVDEELIKTVKIYRDEKNNFDIFLPVGWIVDSQAVILDSQWGGKATVAFTHLPPPPAVMKPDIFIFLSREGTRQGFSGAAQYVEEWVRRDEDNRQIHSRLTQSPYELNLKDGRAAALNVVYGPNAQVQFWQTRAVIADQEGVSYIRGMIMKGDEDKKLMNGKTLREHMQEVIQSIGVISR
jgi:serine/threonine protein kinase